MYKDTGLRLILGAALGGSISATLLAEAPEPQISTSVRNVTTEPLSVLQQRALEGQEKEAALEGDTLTPEPVRVIPRMDRDLPPDGPSNQLDPAVQESAVPADVAPIITPTPTMPPTDQNFEGQGNSKGVLPPDTNGDVGLDHYVQMVNLTLAVYDKTGNPLLEPVDNNTIWTPLGGICASQNDGDPIVLYDQGADRWLVSQFAWIDPNNYHECIAISATGDPTGSWHLYDFFVSDNQINDYPKFGVWPDGYFMSANDFNGITRIWAGTSVYAFERDKMLQGLPARMVKFDFSAADGYWSFLPADWDGDTAPPGGAPNPFVYLLDDAWGYPSDALEIWSFHVDWTTPDNSTFTFTTNLPTAAFDGNMCDYQRNCIPQPAGTPVDAISDRLMFRNQYRNFGEREVMVLNHTVDATSNDQAGVRWYELTNTGSGWGINQQGTYAPDSENRWMGSIAMDKDGNMALGYSVSSTSVHPSIRYTGRLAGDTPNTLPQGEATMVAGGGSQSHSSGRWGDYSAMVVDPVDDCTFWYTQEYYESDSSAGWQTRIASFRFPSCATEATGSLEGNVTDADSGDPIEGAEVNIPATGLIGFTDALGDYDFPVVPVGTYDVTSSASDFFDITVNDVAITDGMTTIQDFALDPVLDCDLDGDDDIDQADVRSVRRDIGESATGPNDPRDPNGDGIINRRDVWTCLLRWVFHS